MNLSYKFIKILKDEELKSIDRNFLLIGDLLCR